MKPKWLAPVKREYNGSGYLRLRDGNRNIAVLHASGVIALQINRPRLAFMTVERATRDSRNFLRIDGLHAVAHDCDRASHERNVEGFPLARLRRDFSRRRQESVDGSDLVEGILFSGLVLDLHFVAPAQIHSAIAVSRAVELNVEFEIIELALGPDIRSRRFVHQFGILHLPVILVGLIGDPTVQTFAIEDRLRRRPCRRNASVQSRRALARYFGLGCAALQGAGELAAAYMKVPLRPPVTFGERDVRALDFDVSCGMRAASAGHDTHARSAGI